MTEQPRSDAETQDRLDTVTGIAKVAGGHLHADDADLLRQLAAGDIDIDQYLAAGRAVADSLRDHRQ